MRSSRNAPARSTLLALLLTAAPAGAGQLYFESSALLFSEPIALDALGNDWNAPLEGGDVMVGVARAEAGVAWGAWRLGYLYRDDYLYRFTPDTAELVHATNNRLELTPGRRYALALDVHRQRSEGLRIAFERALSPTLRLGVALSLLRGSEVMEGGITGVAEAVAGNDYDFAFDVDYAYSEDKLFDRIATPPRGRGHALDLTASWQPAPGWRFDFRGYDLAAAITWYDAPFTTATGSSDTKQYDEQGYVTYRPVISGLESNRDLRQRLPRKLELDGRRQLTPRLALLARGRDYDIERFFSFGAGYRLGRGEVVALADTVHDALTLGWHHPNVVVELAGDAAEIGRARLLALTLALRIALP